MKSYVPAHEMFGLVQLQLKAPALVEVGARDHVSLVVVDRVEQYLSVIRRRQTI